jgi:hypothetical protein
MSTEEKVLPTWFPDKGKAFVAAVVEADASSDSGEYVLVAAHDVVCRCGEEGEEVTVRAGQRFKMESHLFLPLADYVGIGNMGIASTKLTKSDVGEVAWEWAVRLSPAQKTKLQGVRKAAEQAAKPPIPF